MRVSAALLYVVTAALLIGTWRRWVQPIPLSAALVLLLLPLCFTGRALLTGGIYAPIDLPYMSEPLKEYVQDYGINTIKNATLSDVAFQVVPWRKAVRWSLANGEWPLWNPFILCGQVLAGSAQPAVFDPLNLISYIIPLGPSLTYLATISFFLAAFFMFAFLRELDVAEDAALFGAAAWMLSANVAFFIQWPLARSWIYLPLVLLGTRLVVRRPDMRSGALLTAALTLLILAGHPETVLHVVATGVAYGIFELLKVRRQIGARIAAATASGVVALLLSAVYLLPFLDALPQSLSYDVRRDFLAQTPVSTNLDILRRRALSTVVPFYGGSRGRPTADFDPETARCGSVVLAFAVLALIDARRKRETWFFLVLGAAAFCAMMEAWPVAHLLHGLPLFNIALNQRFAFVASFCLVVLATLAIDRVRNGNRLARAAVVLGVATAVVWIAAAWNTQWLHQITVIEALPLVVLAILVVVPVRRSVFVPAIIALLLVQRVAADGSIYPALPQRAFYPRVPLLQAIRPSDEPHRVIGKDYAFIPNTSALYELEDVRGYDNALHRLAVAELLYSIFQPVSFNVITDLRNPLLAFLNVRYAITPSTAQPPEGWRVVMEDRGAKLMENTRVLPRAFVPQRIRYERNDDPVLMGMKRATDFSDMGWVIVPSYKPGEISNGPGTVTTRRAGSSLNLNAMMDGDGWVVISETAWRGWRAYVDGRRVQVHYANHAFLGVFVPKGTHRIRLVYLPEAFTRGRNVTVLTIAGLVALAIWRKRRSLRARE